MNPPSQISSPKKSNTSNRRAISNGATSDLDSLLWRLRARTELSEATGTVIGITSCGRKTGVTTMAANLAIRASENHMGPVLLIDANFVSPRQHRVFKQKSDAGLIDVLIGSSEPEKVIRPTMVDGLDLLLSGPTESLSVSRIRPEMFSGLMTWVRENYSTVFIDLPELDAMRLSLMLARLADTNIVAIRSEATRGSTIATSIERIVADGVKVGGTLLTRKRVYTPHWLRPR